MKFKVGDPVWCLCDVGSSVLPSGGEIAATIVSFSEAHTRLFGSNQWRIEINGDDTWFSHENKLRPRDPPKREREQLGEWELCPWRPVTTPVRERA